LADEFELIVGGLSDVEMLRLALARVDAVMHFAAHAYVGESVQSPLKYFHNNLIQGLSLLEAVVGSKIRKLIFSSTCAVYGHPSKVPIAEDHPRLPVNPYGATKLAFEHALEAYDRAYDLRFVALRYFNAAGADEYGAVGEIHSPETHLIPSAFEAIEGTRPVLQIYGDDYPTSDGTCIRDYIHVTDLAEAHVLALEYLEEGGISTALNLGTGRGHSVHEVISTIESVTGSRITTRVVPRREGDPPELVADPSRARKVLNWHAKRSLNDIVTTAWAWHRKLHPAAAAV
jgi:UDP-glucose-4-epimerase GalE